MSIKKLSNLLDSNLIQGEKTSIDSENSLESDPLKLKSDKLREFELYSSEVIKSKHSKYRIYPEDQFTNFLNEDVVQNFVNNINLFWPDLKKLNDHAMDETDYSSLSETAQLRLERIFKLYLTREFSLKNINKVKLRTNELNKSTSFRIFVLLEEEKYLVFLLDPLHLVVTDRRTRENGVFTANKGNGTCMSKYLK